MKCPHSERRGWFHASEHGKLSEGRSGAGEKVQEVILRAMAKKITWWQAAEITGISDRQMRRCGKLSMTCLQGPPGSPSRGKPNIRVASRKVVGIPGAMEQKTRLSFPMR